MTTSEKLVELFQCLFHESYLDVLMDRAFEYLENPIVLSNPQLALIAERHSAEVEFPAWANFVDYRSFDFFTQSEDDYVRLRGQIENKDITITHIEDGHTMYVKSILANDVFVGLFAMIDQNRTVTPEDFQIIRVITEIVSLKESASAAQAEQNYYEPLLSSLAKGSIDSHSKLDYYLLTARWKPAPSFRIISVEMTRDSTMSTNWQSVFVQSVLSAYPATKYFVDEGTLVLLEEAIHDEQDRTNSRLIALSEHLNVTIGISNTFNDLLDFNVCFLQAQKALRYAVQNQKPVCHYLSISFDDLVNTIRDTVPLWNFCHPGVLRLRLHDQNTGGDLAETLKVYLSCNKSLSKASESLFVHKNTIHYRLKKAQALVAYNRDDGSEELFVLMSLLLTEETPGNRTD